MKSENRSWISRLWIVVIAAVLVEIISIVQYQRIRSIMEEDLDIRSRIAMGAMADKVGFLLGSTEATMRENMLFLRRSLSHPDSVYKALQYTIDDNPNVLSGCIGFEPDYYSSKGYYYEPYVSKMDDGYVYMQLGGPQHDYLENPAYQTVIETLTPDWSDPYSYGEQTLITYCCPVYDTKGTLAGVSGLDMDVSWLGDTLNARQHFHLTFLLLLNGEGKLVAGPSSSKVNQKDIGEAMRLLRDGQEISDDERISVRSISMKKEPYWTVAQVYYMDEVMGPIRKVCLQQVLLILLALAILGFIIERFARSEKKLLEASAEQARIGGELAVARNIQQEMRPKVFPDFIYGSLEPAFEVGGDLFDFYRRDGKLFFCIGDVSGKGVPSAMLMSVVHSLFRTVSQKEESPSRILSALNPQICRGNDSNMFVTFFVGCLDLYTGHLRFANAGHDKPFLLTDQASLLQAKSNLPLGVFPNTEFEEQTLSLSPGTSLFLYTDGLTEAKNADRKAFGRSRVQEYLDASIPGGLSPMETVQSLSDAAHNLAGEAPQSDDIAMLPIRFAPGNLLREKIVLSNQSEELSRLSDFLKDYLKRINIDQKLAMSLRLAVEETVVNVINYAYPPGENGSVTIYAESDYKEIRFTVVDSGIPFDPTAVVPASTSLDVRSRNIGGLGILLTRKIMDSVSYCRKQDMNVFSLTKSII